MRTREYVDRHWVGSCLKASYFHGHFRVSSVQLCQPPHVQLTYVSKDPASAAPASQPFRLQARHLADAFLTCPLPAAKTRMPIL